MTGIELSFGEIISAIGLFVTIVSLLTGALFALYKHIRTTKADLDEQLSATKADLETFKLQVAKEYVGAERLNEMQQNLIRTEERTLAAIQGLAERFDRFLTRTE